MIWFFRIAVLAYVAAVVAAAFLYPDEVPVHFDETGAADRFQDKWGAVASMAGVGLGMALLLWLLIRFFARGSLQHLNIPHKSWWMRTENRERLRAMVTADLAWIGGCTMSVLTAMLLITIRVADDPYPTLGTFGWVALGAFLVAVGGQMVFMYTARYRPDDH